MTQTQHADSEYRSLSYWHDSLPGTLQARPSAEGKLAVDVAIIGAGYTGLWTAYYLKQIDPTLEIAIFEANIAGFGASGRNGGWCSAYLSGIEHWLDNPDTRADAIRLQKLMFETVKEVGRVSSKESVDCHFEQSGTLEIAINRAQLKRLQAEIDYFRELGFGEEDYRWLSQSETNGLLAVDRARAAIHLSHTAAMHPARLARGLAEVLTSKGVALYENSPVIEVGARSIATEAAQVKAGSVIYATEGYSDSLSPLKRRLIPVHSMMVVTEALTDQQLQQTNFNRRYTFTNLNHMVTYGQLTADKRIAFGCRGTYHFGSGIKQFNPQDPEFELVRNSLLRFFPSLRGIHFTHAWGGAMGVSRSLRPSVNYDPESGHGWAGGFFGNGVGATNLAGRTLADLITGQDTDRVNTPWVNPQDANVKWEPEPVRWLGYRATKLMKQMADQKDRLSN